jgi:apurinic endonuclease APN1
MTSPLIGAHLSIAGNFTNALTKTQEIGGNCLQIFSSSPRQWQRTPVSDEICTAFREKSSLTKIAPIYFHASYLVNLADDSRIGEQSTGTMIAELKLAEKMGILGSIIHLGSFKDREKNYEILFRNIETILKNTPENTFFIIENAGNKKIGTTLDELSLIVKTLNNPRIKICLDTCHLFAAGYDLGTKTSFDTYISEFDEKIGLNRLEVFQINDSKDPLGSYRDRHENIGEGTIPPETFRLLLNDPRTKKLPFILETPGFDKTGPDKENVDRLKAFILSPEA